MQIDAHTGRSLTYAQVNCSVRGLAGGLQSRFGIKPGTSVAVALPVCMEYGPTVLAINLLGATAILFNPTQTKGPFYLSITNYFMLLSNT